MKCPHCLNCELTKEFYEKKINFRCMECGGRLMTLSGLRSLCGDRNFANVLWRSAQNDYSETGPACASCENVMRKVTVPLAGTMLELDICPVCQSVWFDPSELERIPLPEPEVREELPQKARELLAMRQIELEEARLNREFSKSSPGAPDAGWKYVLAILGIPVEQESRGCIRKPIVTWSAAILCVIVFVLTLGNLPEAINGWGFIPDQWTRHGGLTVITSMFLHGGVVHLLGNLYFLLVFGDNVEDEFGHWKYILLIAVSGIGATLLHSFFDPRTDIPCVGASGFISGIIVCYAICFPREKLSFMLFGGSYAVLFATGRNWFTIPAWGAFAIWIIFQIVMTVTADYSNGGTAYLAHIGGLLPGILFGIHHRYKRKKEYQHCSKSLDDLKDTRN